MAPEAHGALPVEEAVRAAQAGLRRRQVLDAAVKVMGRNGFHQMSMQDLAREAHVSVGLLYRYFGGKEDLLLATIVRILDAFRDQLAPVIDAAGADVADRLAAGIRRYIEIVDENLDGVVLTYRESRTSAVRPRPDQGAGDRHRRAPARGDRTGVAGGVFRDVDVDVTVFDIVLLAHGWALKHWHFGPAYTVDEYVALQTRHVLNSLVADGHRARYAYLLGGGQ